MSLTAQWPAVYTGIESFMHINASGIPFISKHAHHLHSTTEMQFKDVGLFGTIGAVCQVGARSYSPILYTSISYSIDTTDPHNIEHGAQMEVAFYKDFGDSKKWRIAIGCGLGFHFVNKKVRSLETGLTNIFGKPIGLRLSYRVK